MKDVEQTEDLADPPAHAYCDKGRAQWTFRARRPRHGLPRVIWRGGTGTASCRGSPRRSWGAAREVAYRRLGRPGVRSCGWGVGRVTPGARAVGLQRQLQRAETIITLQKKVAEILGIPLKSLDIDEID